MASDIGCFISGSHYIVRIYTLSSRNLHSSAYINHALHFFFFWEGRSATTGFQPVSSGKDAFTHEPHEEEQCETRALIAHAAEQATIAPTHYSLKPHPWALTRRAGRSARYLPRMLRAEDQIAVCTMRICQCMEGRRLAGMLTLHSRASAKVGPDEATTEFGGHWVMTPRAEACPANVGPTP